MIMSEGNRLDRRGFLKGLLTCIPICGKAIVQPQNNPCHTQTCLAHATDGVIGNSGSSQSPQDSHSTGPSHKNERVRVVSHVVEELG